MASGPAAPQGEGGGGGGGFDAPSSSTNPTSSTVPTATAPVAPSLSPADVHVLLVDDERMQRMVVASLLRKCSYKGEQMEEERGRRRNRNFAVQRPRLVVGPALEKQGKKLGRR